MACMDRALQERHKSRAQAAGAELKSRDGAKTISEMEASVLSEQELRLAAGAVNMTAEDGRLQAELSLREARQHRAWKERWPCHVDGLHCVAIVCCFLSYRYCIPGTAVAAGIRHQDISPGKCVRTRARVPSPSPLRSSVGPESEPSSLTPVRYGSKSDQAKDVLAVRIHESENYTSWFKVNDPSFVSHEDRLQ